MWRHIDLDVQGVEEVDLNIYRRASTLYTFSRVFGVSVQAPTRDPIFTLIAKDWFSSTAKCTIAREDLHNTEYVRLPYDKPATILALQAPNRPKSK